MDRKSVYIFSCCSFVSFPAFGVKLNNEEIIVRGVKEMGKVCNYARRLIQKAACETAADSENEVVEVLTDGYSEYSENLKNVNNDHKNQRSWFCLKNAVAYHVRYDKKKPESAQSTGFRNAVREEVRRIIKETKSVKSAISKYSDVWKKALNKNRR
ncbi:MAG: hypothetical protein LBD60_00280 [Puniceicoccales bacterium]|nr:hypothetical protein [Puniceicoccales bacterium]